ncbi:TPA: GNAT family N-acetyltransferase [Serratia odorifera]|nr:GNAT family N-acetyltransferase [Serratia odorifera]
MQQPIIHAGQFELRPFTLGDAPRVKALVNNPRVSQMTANIPYPYTNDMAEEWISLHPRQWQTGTDAIFAIVNQHNRQLLGAVSLIEIERRQAQIGYWLGEKHWGKGIATQACQTLCRFAFSSLGLHRLQGRHLRCNPASGRVLQKTGFRFAGSEFIQTGLRQRKEWLDLYFLQLADLKT